MGKVIPDDCEGLYSSAYDAFSRGRDSGRDEAFGAALSVLGSLSAEYESEIPVTDYNTAKFAASQECCKRVRLLWERHQARRAAVRMPTEGSA